MGMQSHPPAFQFYPKDFSGDGIVEAMTTEEVGAYILLICKAWHQDPVGTIPDDDRILARWSRLSIERWQECRAGVLAAFKKGDDGRWHQTRLIAEYAKLIAFKEERSRSGKHGADVKKQRQSHATQTPQTNEAQPKLSLCSASQQHEANSSFPPPSPSPNLRNVTGRSAKAELKGYSGFIASKLPTPKSSRDIQLLGQAGRAVDERLIAEDLVASALQGCDGKDIRNPWAVFYSALQKNVAATGADLDRIFETLGTQAVAS